MTVPCRECPDRYVGCHSKCDKYKEYADELHKIREARATTLAGEDYEVARTRKAKKYWRRKNGR